MEENLRANIISMNENDTHTRDEALHLLSDICNKILTCPTNVQYRDVLLNDSTVINKLLPAVGAMECLFNVGFVENGDRLSFPSTSSLSNLEILQKLLPKPMPLQKKVTHIYETSNKFFKEIISEFRNVLRYENPVLQSKARRVVPIKELEIKTINRIRDVQKISKLNNQTLQDENLIAKDIFLIELLHWFKNEFFKWMDSPNCTKCNNPCKLQVIKPSTKPGISSVEVHKCETCASLEEFPRYQDPEYLLTTRVGRCGEWANVFTLLCRSFGYDTRIVHDKTDHVWTEVWSDVDKKWIHVDSCEATINKPLMYERGWCKKLTYIIAYSKDEVQDVTWRYTCNQLEVMRRRKLCSEKGLIELIRNLNEDRQDSPNYSTTRKEFVLKRSIMELVQLLHTPNQNNKDDETYEGRTSGSLAWRLARNETSQNDQKHVWIIGKSSKTFQLSYFIVEDIYRIQTDDNSIIEKKNWVTGTNTTEGRVFRKVENDWKMVYLARSSDFQQGEIKWTFQVDNSNSGIGSFTLKAITQTYENAQVEWKIETYINEKKITNVLVPLEDRENFETVNLNGVSKLDLVVTLKGGRGDVAWQHAQLFRESLTSVEKNSMLVSIQLCPRQSF